MEVECVEVEPRAVLEDVRALMQGTADQKGIELAIDVDEDVPARLCSDPVRLHQVVLNLVSNAVKFTEVGQVRISARRRPSSTSPCAIAIDVEDTGIGIDPEKIETIFEPFRQADATTTRSHGGTGLGLCLSRRLAEKLGGRLSVESTPGRGSRFTFHLDAMATGRDSTPAAGPAARQGETAPTAEGDAAPLDGVRVLLAEDGPDNRHLITYFLKRAGAEVVHAENGREAIEAIDRAAAAGDRIDVVLMDMQMPVMDGYTAAGILRSRGNRIPVIALTAHAMSSDRDRCIEAGCDDYLPKPIDRATLIDRVATAGRRGGSVAPGVG
jgi:CheY-like chemotaxis protein